MRIESFDQFRLPGGIVAGAAPPPLQHAPDLRTRHAVVGPERGCAHDPSRHHDCRRSPDYWWRLKHANTTHPPVHPLPYSVTLAQSRAIAEEARSAAEARIDGQPAPRLPEPAPREPRQPAPTAPDEPRSLLYAAPRLAEAPPAAALTVTQQVRTAYEVQRFAAPGNLVDLVI